jgi:heat shock protein HslJ
VRIRSARPIAALALATALVTAGCGLVGSSDDNANGGLAFTSWTVSSIAGTSTIAESPPTMAFDPAGTVAGTDGCNQYTGTFHTDGGSIQVGPLATTRMACEPARNAQATAFGAAFSGATSWRLLESGELELTGHGDILATPGVAAPPSDGAPPAAGLPGTEWTLIDLDGSVEFDATLAPQLTFADDGTLAGFAGCNTYNGSFTLDGSSIDIGPLTTTKMACPPPASDIESAYLPALDAVGSWEIQPDGQLVLSGPQVLTYQPA